MTDRIGRFAATILCFLVVSAALSACGSGGNGGKGPQVLRVGTLSEIDTLNPFTSQTNEAAEISTLTWPTLVIYDNTGSLKPAFGRAWKFGPDGKSVTFTVASGGRWSDGKPLTADDAAWTIQTIVKFAAGATGGLASYAPAVTGATSAGPTTLTVRFNAPAPIAFAQLTQVPILPRHIWQRYAAGDGKQLTTYPALAPIVGGGPFSVRSYRKGQALTLDRNPGYFGPKPHVSRIGFAFYSNTDALSTAIANGEVDAAERVEPSGAAKLRGGGLVVQTPDSLNELWLTISSSAKAKHPELRNALVRQALDLAVDRNRVVQTAYYGSAAPGSTLVPPALPEAHLDGAPTFDVAQANALLDQAGFKRGADGTRVANGHPMSYKVIVLNDPGGPEGATLQILRNDFRSIGIKLQGTVLDAAAAIPAIFGPNNSYSTFDFSLLTAGGSFDPSFILSWELCSNLGVNNFAGYCNPHYDALFKQLSTTTDHASRVDLLKQLQRLLSNDRPVLVIAYARDVYAHSKSWDGLLTGPGGWFYTTLEAALAAQRK